MSNILVIGNGFDLAHGLKTSYSDFIEMVKLIKNDEFKIEDIVNRNNKIDDIFKQIKEITKENCFLSHFIHCNNIEDSWCGVEDEIEKVVNVWIEILDNVTVKGRINNWNSEMRFVNQSFNDLIEIEDQIGRIETNTFPRFETEVFKKLKEIYVNERGVNKYLIINILKNELNNLIKAFELYLQLFVESVTPDQCFNLSNISPDMIVNFNYTETHKIYNLFSKHGEGKVKYIHGKIGCEPNNIVMGMNIYGDVYNKDFIYFMKFFQRIQHKTHMLKARYLFDLHRSISYLKPAAELKSRRMQYVYFIGHSMSNADGDVIRLLKNPIRKMESFEIKSNFIIFYFNQNDYEQKVINLFEVFGKDDTIQMIHDEEIIFLPLETIMYEKQATK